MKYNLATYLIDFENVRSDGLKGINWLSENDIVVIFYSNNADTLTFEAMDLILNSNATIRKFKIARGGKNALDFQLATYLGFLIQENKNPYFYIISKDNGFHYVIDFWKRTYRYEGYVFCCASISEAYSKQKRFDSYSQSEKEAMIEELNQEELEKETLEDESPVSEENNQPDVFSENEEPADYNQYELSFPSDLPDFTSTVFSSEAAVCEEPIAKKEETESLLSEKPTDSEKTDSDTTPNVVPHRQTRTKKSASSEKGKKKASAPKPKKTNLGELSADLLLPLSSPIVQKAISLTGDLCNENQAQVAASHLIQSSGKQDFYRKMTAYFGQKHGIAVYNSLRSEYTNIRKNEA